MMEEFEIFSRKGFCLFHIELFVLIFALIAVVLYVGEVFQVVLTK